MPSRAAWLMSTACIWGTAGKDGHIPEKGVEQHLGRKPRCQPHMRTRYRGRHQHGVQTKDVADRKHAIDYIRPRHATQVGRGRAPEQQVAWDSMTPLGSPVVPVV